MAFLLYGSKDSTTWTRIREFPLGQLLATHVRGLLETDAEKYGLVQKPPFSWEADKEELLRLEGQRKRSRYAPPQDPQGRLFGPVSYQEWALVIDLKPDWDGVVSLYRLKTIWGYSERACTAICVRLEPLFVDLEVEDSIRFKNEFQLPPGKEPVGPVHEFLYLNHLEGVRGAWTWGQVRNVNGALLWPKALAYFIERILLREGVTVDYKHIFASKGVPSGLLAKRKPRRSSRAR
jgi:hypothetical protein